MTQKDYVILAEVIKEHMTVTREFFPDSAANVRDLVSSLALALQQDNPRFDRDKFYAACVG